MLGASDGGYGLRKKKSGMCHVQSFDPEKIFRLCSMHHETPRLTRYGRHVFMQTLATVSQGFNPKRGTHIYMVAQHIC
jgi:hypothetical protein